MNNQVFLYGPDTFRLHQTLIEIRRRYVEKNGANTEIVNLDGGETKPAMIDSHILTLPLFASKRLIILRGAITAKNQPAIDVLTAKKFSLPESTLLVIFEPAEIRQTKALAPIFDNSTVKYFPLLREPDVRKYICSYVAANSGTIDSESVEYLTKNFRNNLWALTNELDKLLSFSRNISPSSVKKLVAPNEQVVIFDIIDNVLAGQAQKALLIADQLRRQGEPSVLLISLLSGAYKNMIAVSLCLKENITNFSRIAASLKLHPFVVKKTLPLSRSIPLPRLIQTYKSFTQIDADIKRGIIEDDIGLDLLIVGLCQT